MKIEMTPEEHARLHRRRGRQALGLVIAVLVLIGVLTVLHAGVNAVAKLFDDTAQKQEYEDKLEGLVLFDPVPFEGIENIDDLTLREAAVCSAPPSSAMAVRPPSATSPTSGRIGSERLSPK